MNDYDRAVIGIASVELLAILEDSSIKNAAHILMLETFPLESEFLGLVQIIDARPLSFGSIHTLVGDHHTLARIS